MYAQIENNNIANERRVSRKKLFCIFASYAFNGCVSPELVYLLKAINEICSGIVFVADNSFDDSEFSKIKDLVVYAECEKHGKYDFGSYAKGLKWFKNSHYYNEVDELLFCNDSILGPYRSLQYFLVKKQQKGNPKFFGCTINYLAHTEIYPHVQSYFFTVDKSIFKSDYFYDFFQTVKAEEDKTTIVLKNEIGLSKLLESHGVKPEACFSQQLLSDPCREFIEHFDDMFFVKRNRLKYYHTYKLNMMLKKTGFDYYIINGRFVKKNLLYTLLVMLFFVFEPARIVREFKFYKKRKYDKKIAKMGIINNHTAF